MTTDMIIHRENTGTVVAECTFNKERAVRKLKPKTMFSALETEESGS